MSREIKFRAWDDKDKFWYPAETMIDFFDYLSEEFAVIAGWFNKEAISLEQYTGLKDKNGKEIYEGDIVKISGEVVLNDDICVDPVAEIVWVDSAAGFGEKFTAKKAPMVPVGLYKYEVVGNIHENPESLKGEE